MNEHWLWKPDLCFGQLGEQDYTEQIRKEKKKKKRMKKRDLRKPDGVFGKNRP